MPSGSVDGGIVFPAMRRRTLFQAMVIVAVGVLALPSAALADDTTPPVGTLEVEGGLGYTTDGTVVLDVPATDDVGVTTLRVRDIHGVWTDYPYTPQFIWTFDTTQIAQQQLTIEVGWLDAAGNASYAQKTIWYDAAPPDLQIFKASTDPAPPRTVLLYLGAYEEASGVAAARFSTDNGVHWGEEIPMTDQNVAWPLRDATFGGKPGGLGPVKVLAKVRDGSGQWSNVRSTTVSYTTTVDIGVSSTPTTGESITFTPKWADPVTFPAGTYCSWEFMTGDDQSLYVGDHDASYSYNLTQGRASGGWCQAWTFTLPWSPVRQYRVSFRAMLSDGSEIDADLGSPEKNAFTSVVGSTNRTIRSSNLPLFYVLPDAFQLTVGVPTTYRGYAIGGATITTSDRWNTLQGGALSHFYPGADSFTFTPQRAGPATVCLSRGPGSTPMDQLGACFDPPVDKAAGGGTISPPFGGGAAPSGAPDSSGSATGGLATDEPSVGAGLASTPPGDVAIAAGGASETDRPLGLQDQGAFSRGSTPGLLWLPVLIAAAIVAIGAGALLQPGLRSRIRHRLRR